MTTLGKIRIAAAQYDIGFFPAWHAFEEKINQWVRDAVANDARLLVFPEYASMELVSLFSMEIAASLPRQLEALQTLLADYLDLFQGLASSHGLYILAGSIPVRHGDGDYRNRAYLFYPDGSHDYQDKLQMTRFENEHWLIRSGERIKVFDTEFGRLGINICYDSEFPLIARQQAELGAHLILVPSCTDTLAGYYRVRVGAQARALENQCYVIQAPTVGNADWSEAVDVNIGAAAVYTPMDHGFPEDGILAKGALNTPQWVFADLDLALTEQVRRDGQVFNYRDWPGQHRFLRNG